MKKFISTFLIFVTLGVYGQQIDSLQMETLKLFDSLLNTWYYNKNLDTSKFSYDYNADNYIDIADSIIIDRLRRIPTTIKLSFTPEVNSWIRIYLKKGKYLIPSYLTLSNYYFPLFEKYIDRKCIPHELKYLAIVESALNPRARSRAGAVGLWQFMIGTARLYNLEINTLVDERMDPEKSTQAAIDHLYDLYTIFNDWILAVAAYNCGAGNVRKAIARSGGKTDFWEIYRYLPRETRGYVPAFIAMIYIMNYAKEHNFRPADIDLPYETDTIMIYDTLHLLQVSKVLEIPYEQLVYLNPQYKEGIIPGYYKPYPLRLPANKIVQFLVKESEINRYKDSINFNKLYIASNYALSGKGYRENYPCNKIDTKNLAKITYTVKEGENLSTIAQLFNVTVTELKCWNNLYRSRVYAGQKLIIYKSKNKIDYYSKIDALSYEEKQKLLNLKAKSQVTADDKYVYYTVKAGESLYTIAQKFEGVTYLDLLEINGFTKYDAKNLKPGQVIKIKKK